MSRKMSNCNNMLVFVLINHRIYGGNKSFNVELSLLGGTNKRESWIKMAVAYFIRAWN